MMKKLCLFILYAFLCIGTSHAQVNIKGLLAKTPLSKGDVVPFELYAYLAGALHNPSLEKKLPHQLLILDFWGIYCAPCIASMPEMERLQNKFAPRLQVIFVTRNNESEVATLRGKSRIVRDNHLPSLTGDTVLQKFFPYITVPTQAWIMNGVVLHITAGYNSTEAHISKVLHGKKIILIEKRERSTEVIGAPLWQLMTLDTTINVKFCSLLTGPLHNYNGGLMGFYTDNGHFFTGLHARNASLASLLSFRYSAEEPELLDPERMILEGLSEKDFFPPEEGDQLDKWNQSHRFCYELRTEPSTKEEILNLLGQDMERYFHLKCYLEKRPVPCLVLKRMDSSNTMGTRGNSPELYVGEDHKEITVRNRSFSDFLRYGLTKVLQSLEAPALVDKTGLKGKIDLELHFKDLSTLIKELERYHLTLTEEVRPINMLIVRHT